MAGRVARAIHCELDAQKPAILRRESGVPVRQVPVPRAANKPDEPESSKRNIVLQPRLCTLRSYAEDPFGVVKTRTRREDGGDDEMSRFFETLSDYIESSKKSHDFEIMTGRLAMVVFAATVSTELVTGNSVFRKMDFQGIVEAAGVCLGAVTFAAIFAFFSRARGRVGRIFTVRCNSFIDSLIDDIVDGLFYDIELSDWSDDT